DRIAFIEGLKEKIETDYNELLGNEQLLQNYAAALNVVRTGKIKDNVLSPDQVRRVVRNAITKIGSVDKQYAITLAHHVASEYNNGMVNYHGK
ncbi:MAG: hypothetical protein AABX85_00495, partial [Nanoarchaeota archaeon]